MYYRQRTYSPISSTLIYGKHDAVLVDTFLTGSSRMTSSIGSLRAARTWRRSISLMDMATIGLVSERSWAISQCQSSSYTWSCGVYATTVLARIYQKLESAVMDTFSIAASELDTYLPAIL
jgi:hypothetical protein